VTKAAPEPFLVEPGYLYTQPQGRLAFFTQPSDPLDLGVIKTDWVPTPEVPFGADDADDAEIVGRWELSSFPHGVWTPLVQADQKRLPITFRVEPPATVHAAWLGVRQPPAPAPTSPLDSILAGPLPAATRQLLAATVDAVGTTSFDSWLATWAAVTGEPQPDKRLVIREQTQQGWVNSMRASSHPLLAELVKIYDAANSPIAAGSPPLTAEAADSVLDIYLFQDAVVNGAKRSASPALRANWRAHLVACYPTLPPPQQQWIAAAPLTAPMIRAGWHDLAPSQRETQKQEWATQLPQLSMFIQNVMQTANPSAPHTAGPGAPAGLPQPAQPTPQQTRQNDQMYVNALQNVANSNMQAMMAVARNFRA
jgi:hypothetical protein